MTPKTRDAKLMKLLELFDQLDPEAKKDVLDHARLVLQKQEAEQNAAEK